MVFFVLLSAKSSGILYVALAVFVIAGLTDILDGYLARKEKTQSSFGRVADPFVDKFLTCGGFILLIGKVPMLQAWMVLTIVARELLVTAMRSFAESRDVSFSATRWGKSKAFAQNVALGGCVMYLALLHRYSFGKSLITTLLYVAVVATVASGLVYILNAKRLLMGKAAQGHCESRF